MVKSTGAEAFACCAWPMVSPALPCVAVSAVAETDTVPLEPDIETSAFDEARPVTSPASVPPLAESTYAFVARSLLAAGVAPRTTMYALFAGLRASSTPALLFQSGPSVPPRLQVDDVVPPAVMKVVAARARIGQ